MGGYHAECGKKNLPEKSDANSENPLYNSDKSDRICNDESLTEDGGPGSGNHGHKGVPGKVGGSAPTPSARGSNPGPVGFEHKKTAEWKLKKHSEGYEGVTLKEFEQRAIELLSKPCDKDIDGYLKGDGSIVRFDKSTGDVAIGYPGSYVKTMFNPGYNKGGKFDLERAIRYFEKHKAEEGVSDGESGDEA